MEVKISFEVMDITAKGDASCGVSSAQPFTFFTQLVDGHGVITDDPMSFPPLYATGEPETFRLDGSMSLIDEEFDPGSPINPNPEPVIGWWSKEMSDGTGAFETLPVVTIQFSSPHSSAGITIHFDRSTHLSRFIIRWYNSNGLITDEEVSENALTTAKINKKVDGYTRITITAIKTDRPYRYCKIQEIDFGLKLTFTNHDIITASVLEESPVYPSELPTGELSFSVLNTDQMFNIVNPDGIYAYLREMQKIELVASGEGGEISGTYYLKKWESTNGKAAKLVAVDPVGKLNAQWRALEGYVEGKSQFAIEDIGVKCGVPIMLDSAYNDIDIKGIYASGPCPRALLEICMVLGTVPHVNRNLGGIEVVALPSKNPDVWGESVMLGTPKVTQTQLIGAVTVKSHSYSRGAPFHYESIPATLDFPVGRYEMTLNPHDYIDMSGIIVASMNISVDGNPPDLSIVQLENGNDAVLFMINSQSDHMAQNVHIAISGNVIQVSESEINTKLADGGKTLKIENNGLVTPYNNDVVMNTATQYCKKRLKATFRRLFTPFVMCGDLVNFPVGGGNTMTGNITKIEYCLNAGGIMSVEVVG